MNLLKAVSDQLPCSCISKEDIRTEPSNFCSSLCTDRNPDISFGHRHLYNRISSARTSEDKIFMPKNYREEFSTIWINIKWLHRSTSSAIFRNLLFFVALRIDCWPISVESHMQISNFNRFVCFHNETVFIERKKSVLAHEIITKSLVTIRAFYVNWEHIFSCNFYFFIRLESQESGSSFSPYT